MKIQHITLSILLLFPAMLMAQTGIIRGKITNAKNNTALPFVNVAIPGTSSGAVSDTAGFYQIRNLKPGQYNVTASFIGFETQTAFEIEVTNSKPATVDFLLEEVITSLKGVEVKASPFTKKEESPISMRTLGVSEIARNPGGNRDISKVIQSLPGVAQTVSFRNDIIIRGGSPNENRFYLDDIEIPNINHFATQGASGGPVGMINVDFVRDVSFYSSAFPANRNNSLSSVMEFKFRDGREDRMGTKFTLGASDMGLTAEGPIGKKTTFIASARRSYLQFLFKVIGLPFLPTYNDFQFKVKYKPDAKNEFTLLGIGAIDDFTLNTELQKTGDDQQKYILGYLPVQTQWNYMNGVKYVHYRNTSYSTLVLSRNMLNNESEKYRNNDDSNPANKILKYKSQEIENKFRYEETRRFNGYKLNYGIGFENSKYTNATYNLISMPWGVDTLNFSSDLTIDKWGLFGQLSKSFFNNRLGLSFGIRSDGNDYNKAMINSAKQLSPRLSVSYSILPNFTFNANCGYYYQLPAYTVLGYRNNNNELVNKANGVKYIRAKHLVSGFEYISKKNLKLNVEGFLKIFQNYPFAVRDSISLANVGSDFGVIGNEEVVSTSEGRSYGIEFLAQQKLFKGFYGMITYTFVRSEFKDKNDIYVPSSWDNRNIVNITLGKSLKRNWELGAKWRYSMGSPFTPYNIPLSVQIANWQINGRGIPDYDNLNKMRLPAFHQLDIRVDKKYYLKKFTMEFYVDIQNLYNFQSELPPILDVVRDADGNPVVSSTDPSSFEYKTIESFTGTVLPTVGIVIEF
ncbi:MAG: TonB-dependent receptor [Bacteroidota bacterium]